jgi:hypothetical protein
LQFAAPATFVQIQIPIPKSQVKLNCSSPKKRASMVLAVLGIASQTPRLIVHNSNVRSPRSGLVLPSWNLGFDPLFGIWSLGFGICSTNHEFGAGNNWMNVGMAG